MDAVKNHEWRMFIFLRKQKDNKAYIIFNILHISLFVFISWILSFSAEPVKTEFLMCINIFFIIHFFLHLIFLKHPSNEFTSIFSWLIICGMCLSGVAALLL